MDTLQNVLMTAAVVLLVLAFCSGVKAACRRILSGTGGKSKNIQTKREREKEMVSEMIALYCGKQHGRKCGLCPECAALEAYARQRSDKCPFMETKTFCSNCKVHCYEPGMRERIRAVMRFSGPRMIFHHPVAAVRHVLETKREKRRMEKCKEA